MAMAMEWTEQQKREMYEDGVRSPPPSSSSSAPSTLQRAQSRPPHPPPPRHLSDVAVAQFLIVRGIVPPELVGPALEALESGAGGGDPRVLALLYDSPLCEFLNAGLRGGGFNKIEGSQAGANGPREPETHCKQTGWPELDPEAGDVDRGLSIPNFGWCGHVDGIWSGGSSAPQTRDDPNFDEAAFYSEPAVNGHMKEYGVGPDGCGVNLQLFSALVGVSLSDQTRDGAGQIGVLKGAHLPLADFYSAQRAQGGPVGPGGPFWPREDFNAPNGHGVRHYPDYLRDQFPEDASYTSDGMRWPKPTFMKLMPGDAVLILGHTPHAASRCTMDQGWPRMQCYFRATACWRDKGGDPEHIGKLIDTCCDPWLDWPPVAEYAERREAAQRRNSPIFGSQSKL